MNIEFRLLRKRTIAQSPDGRFKDCWYWSGFSANGYGFIRINKKSICVARASAHIHLEFDLNSKLEVCHKCDNGLCFNPDHIFIGTHQDNMKDMHKKDRNPKGEKIGASNLTVGNILQIRKFFEKDRVHPRKLAEMFNISISSMWDIVRRRTWKHV